MNPGEEISNASDLRPGDVVLVVVMLRDRATGAPFPWKRFACVMSTLGKRGIEVVNLRPQLTDRDYRTIDLRSGTEQGFRIPEAEWPQGVIAMRMKLITLGVVKLGDVG